jgi:hypothetical protein
MSQPPRQRYAVSLNQALADSPPLARLTRMARESGELLVSVESLIPAALRSSVNAGPIDGVTWCLFVRGNAAGAKIRQLLPLLEARLKAGGAEVTSIRLKVLMTQAPR